MKKVTLVMLFACSCLSLWSQQYAIKGRVVTKETSTALSGATVAIRGSVISVATNTNGYFSFEKIAGENITLIVSHIGYETIELPVKTSGKQTILLPDIVLNPAYRKSAEVVVSASKRPEKITDAPASIQVIGLRDFEQTAGFNVNEMLANVQGIEYTRYGIDGITFNARGLNTAFHNKVLQLVDGRISMAALSANLPIYSLSAGSYIIDDLEQLEIITGPQTALHGPNAHNAVLNFISKDPRKYPGTTAAISAGNHYQLSARFRQASKINNKWAYKITGEYATGKEFDFYDSVRLNPQQAVPEHNVNFNFRHLRGEAHLYYSISAKTDIILSGGGSNNNTIQVTTGGRNQMRGVTYNFLQAKLVNPHFYASIYNTWGNIGTSYNLRIYTSSFWANWNSGMSPDSAEAAALSFLRFKESSQRTNAEFQYNNHFEKAGLFLIAGLNYQNERPNGYGINLIDDAPFRIHITQYGGVIQLEKTLPLNIRTIVALRYDRHKNFGGYYAPKFALIKNIGETSLRISWARAYAMPNIQSQYAGIGRYFFGNGGAGITYTPNGANINEASVIKATKPIVPEQVGTWELNYKGNITKKLYFDINYYNGISKNFLSPDLAVEGRALTVNGTGIAHNPFFAGTVDNNGVLQNAVFYTFFNYGRIRTYGIDAGLNYLFCKYLNLSVKYSLLGANFIDAPSTTAARSLNSPKNRLIAIVGFQNLLKNKIYINLSSRYVEQYDFYSGIENGTKEGAGKWPANGNNFDWGPLGGFTTFNISAGCQLNKQISFNISVSNLFNTKQIEMAGSPSIERLIIAEIKVHVPDGFYK